MLWELGWQALRDNQVAALPLILDTRNDVVISAATAVGKTEAAFLPLLTRLWQGQQAPTNAKASAVTAGADPKGLILYDAPVKSLIDDQVERLHVFVPAHGHSGLPVARRCRPNQPQKVFRRPVCGADHAG